MPPLDLAPRFLRSPAAFLRAAFATSRPRRPLGPRNTLHRPTPPPPRTTSEPEKQTSQSHQSAEGKQPSVDAVSKSLREASAADNNLLTPVNIPEDPDGVLNEQHPAAKLLSHSSLVVTRQLEMMNVMLGFEQANRYVGIFGASIATFELFCQFRTCLESRVLQKHVLQLSACPRTEILTPKPSVGYHGSSGEPHRLYGGKGVGNGKHDGQANVHYT